MVSAPPSSKGLPTTRSSTYAKEWARMPCSYSILTTRHVTSTELVVSMYDRGSSARNRPDTVVNQRSHNQ